MRWVFAFALLILLASPGGFTQTGPAFAASDAARSLIRELASFEAVSMDLTSAQRDAFTRSLKWIANAQVPAEVPVSLISSLRASLRLLRSEASPRAKAAAIEDLFLKADLCRRSPNGLGAAISVQVRTLQATAEARGWEVVYKSAPEMEIPEIPPTPFGQFSSPTSWELAAGRYTMWARDPKQSTRNGNPRELLLTGSSASVAFDLTVPTP